MCPVYRREEYKIEHVLVLREVAILPDAIRPWPFPGHFLLAHFRLSFRAPDSIAGISPGGSCFARKQAGTWHSLPLSSSLLHLCRLLVHRRSRGRHAGTVADSLSQV